ncbi:hypothetical protein 2 [Beihai sobemo-like virus 3]|uniref:hypothetical protein 2 n=1 Tax=Beihai sobemo-like virus 3 TaxID=1922700 RepID=UPI00090AF1BD|nr:hypothetical protein 2 [Beihai sobemo-like virus 3]APG75709.1 hypothetical protein 2 [Beihai sobemo-like virus 3]
MPRRWGRSSPSDAVLVTGVQQGAAAAVPKAFGSTAGRRWGNRRRTSANSRPNNRWQRRKRAGIAESACWDAFSPVHLALPRAVAPYATIRTTAIWNPDVDAGDGNKFALFGPYLDGSADAGQWSNLFSLTANTALSNPKNTNGGAKYYAFESMISGSWKAASVTPAAFSIQIMNPEALQTSSGAVYIGRCKNRVSVQEGVLTETWQLLAEELVSYSNPRICSAGKLALRGVQIDAIPNNMSELANFTTLKEYSDHTTNLSSTVPHPVHPSGFNPIFVYNPDGVKLQILVCCEWRVRFDPSNPAYAACSSHKPTSDTTWHKHMQHALAAGNGVLDIAEKVARYGVPIAKAAGYLGGA